MKLHEACGDGQRERRREALVDWLPWRKNVVELEGSVKAAPFQQALLEAKLVLVPELKRHCMEKSNVHLAVPCPRMLIFLLEGLGPLAADLDALRG